jgi:hypothetical protein
MPHEEVKPHKVASSDGGTLKFKQSMAFYLDNAPMVEWCDSELTTYKPISDDLMIYL